MTRAAERGAGFSMACSLAIPFYAPDVTTSKGYQEVKMPVQEIGGKSVVESGSFIIHDGEKTAKVVIDDITVTMSMNDAETARAGEMFRNGPGDYELKIGLLNQGENAGFRHSVVSPSDQIVHLFVSVVPLRINEIVLYTVTYSAVRGGQGAKATGFGALSSNSLSGGATLSGSVTLS